MKFKYNIPSTEDYRAFLPEEIMSRWRPEIQAGKHDDNNAVINIFDIVGESFFSDGITAKKVAAVLSENEGNAVTVNINSPGGDFFEGVAILNLLSKHDGDVNVRILGMAASAAAVIAMAGDTISIAESAFLMIHNAWNIVVGNKNEMRDMANTLEQFDNSMIGVFSKKTGLSKAEITEMMDAETWIGGEAAVEQGFATDLLDDDEVVVEDNEQAKYNTSLKEVDIALAKAGKTRSERRVLIKDLTNTPGAVGEQEPTPCAGNETLLNAIVEFNKTLSPK